MYLALNLWCFVALVGATLSEENRHLRYEKVSRHVQDDKLPDQVAHHADARRKELVHQNKENIHPGKRSPIHHVGGRSHNRRRMQYEDTGCLESEIYVEVELLTDFYANETSWEVTRDQDGFAVMSGSGFSNAQTSWNSACLPKNCYTFNISDAKGDG
jgi:hypothetical protein